MNKDKEPAQAYEIDNFEINFIEGGSLRIFSYLMLQCVSIGVDQEGFNNVM